jgi:Protein of unknown function (DUF3467)
VNEEPAQEVQVEVPPELEVGVYANFALVSFSEHDFNIDFCQILPQPSETNQPKVRVVSRVRIAPSFIGPLLQAISQNAFRREEAIKKAQEGGEEA